MSPLLRDRVHSALLLARCTYARTLMWIAYKRYPDQANVDVYFHAMAHMQRSLLAHIRGDWVTACSEVEEFVLLIAPTLEPGDPLTVGDLSELEERWRAQMLRATSN